MRLKPLRTGDRIALVAPSSPFETEKYQGACEILRKRGFVLVPGRHLFCRKGYLAGTESERVQDLIEALRDPSVAAVFCVRGGYGSSRLLPWIPFSGIRANRKIFMGYSDITFLHVAFQSQMNWPTFHGPNLIDLMDVPERADVVIEAFRGGKSFSWNLEDRQILRHGVVTGNLLGGNLTCFAHLIGSPYFPDVAGALLLVEDCAEALYRLDRLFMQLKLAGILTQLGGLILGDFKDCAEATEIHRMVLDHVRTYRLPVIANLPFGHGCENQVVPLGIPFYLNTYERTFRATRHPLSG